MCSRAYKKISLLYRSSVYLDTQQMAIYYKSALRPLIECAAIIFDNYCSNNDNLRLENVQRRTALMCTGAMKRTETVKLLSDLNWDTVKSRRDTAKLVVYYKIMNASAPAYLTNLLPWSNTPERYNFRRHDRTKHIKTRFKMYELSFFPSCSEMLE